MNFLKNPDVAEILPLLENALTESKMVLLIGRCSIEYSGRAKSTLGYGERLVIIKPDKTLLVHRKEGAKPINWQPPNGVVTFTESNGLIVRAIRPSPREIMIIHLERILAVAWFSLEDNAVFDINATELDMHKAILNNPNLIEPGFKPLKHEKKVTMGFIDIFGLDENGNPTVIEVKKNPVTSEDIDQLRSYMSDILLEFPNQKVRSIIAGPSMTNAAKISLVASNPINIEFKKLTVEKCLRYLKPSDSHRLSDYL